jgi:hypothetical protein
VFNTQQQKSSSKHNRSITKNWSQANRIRGDGGNNSIFLLVENEEESEKQSGSEGWHSIVMPGQSTVASTLRLLTRHLLNTKRHEKMPDLAVFML